MSQTDAFQIVYSPHVAEFVTVANEFCKFLEHTDDYSKTEFVDKSLKISALLYLKATLLPAFDVDDSEQLHEKFVTEAQWEHVSALVTKKLGLHNEHVEILTSDVEFDAEARISLAECFADIYQDVRDFVGTYAIGHDPATLTALDECRANFATIWGPRLLAVARALHRLNYGGLNLDYDVDEADSPPKEKLDTRAWFLTRAMLDYEDQSELPE